MLLRLRRCAEIIAARGAPPVEPGSRGWIRNCSLSVARGRSGCGELLLCFPCLLQLALLFQVTLAVQLVHRGALGRRHSVRPLVRGAFSATLSLDAGKICHRRSAPAPGRPPSRALKIAAARFEAVTADDCRSR